MIRALRIPLASVPAALALTIAFPSGGLAQFGGTMDLHSGPVAWDNVEGGDPLLNGEVAGSYRFRSVKGMSPELLGRFGLSTGPDEGAATRYDLGVRLHTTGGGLWLGAAAGAAGKGSSTSALTRLEGGVRRSLGPARIDLWLARTGFGGRIVSGGGLNQDSAGSDTLARRGVSEYTDVGSRVMLSLSRYEVGLALTRRIGGGFSRRSGWELNGTWWVAPNVAVVGATGHALSQFGLSLPGGRFGTVGLRLAVGARAAPAPAPRAPDETSTATPTLAISHRRLTFSWAPARTAEVMGDFTDWQPRSLVALGGGRWTLPVELSPGVHHLNVRFDGGPWLVPTGAAAVDDGFGGRVGLVVVR